MIVLFLWLHFTVDLDSHKVDSENCSRDAEKETKKKTKKLDKWEKSISCVELWTVAPDAAVEPNSSYLGLCPMIGVWVAWPAHNGLYHQTVEFGIGLWWLWRIMASPAVNWVHVHGFRICPLRLRGLWVGSECCGSLTLPLLHLENHLRYLSETHAVCFFERHLKGSAALETRAYTC